MKTEQWTAVYARVSTKKPPERVQDAELQEFVKARRLRSVRWYRDAGAPSTPSRPAFERLQADIAKGKVATVVLWRLDRAARNLRDGVNVLADWCARGVRIISMAEGVDVHGRCLKTLAAFLASVAEMERLGVNERIRAGMAAARARGVRLGRPKGRVTDPARRRLNPIVAKQMYVKGARVREIADRFGVTPQAVYREVRVLPQYHGWGRQAAKRREEASPAQARARRRGS